MLHALVMAGGSGTRFWPESRVDRPKQLLTMLGDRTMIQTTIDRLGDLVPPERVFVATTERLAGRIAEQLSELPREAILVEPCKRDTAPCIGLAAARILREDPDATMAVMPSDHVIEPEERFRDAIRLAADLVDRNPERLVTFGVRPTYPAESFGYIERGERLEPEAGRHALAKRGHVAPNMATQTTPCHPPPTVYRVEKFHEKPNAQVAAEYLEAGVYYWNSGIFLWKARTILDALARYEPELSTHLEQIAGAADTSEFGDVLAREFAAIEAISIDFAVMERASDVVVIEAPFGWDDVGSWRALERLGRPDSSGNVIEADKHLEIRTTGTIARVNVPDHAVVLVGVEDLVVIVTPDVTLVANKHDEESIRGVTKLIEEHGWEEHL